jgi:hypothetical protein
MTFVALYQLCDRDCSSSTSARCAARAIRSCPPSVQAVLVWTHRRRRRVARVAAMRRSSASVGPWTLATIFGGILGILLLTRFLRGRMGKASTAQAMMTMTPGLDTPRSRSQGESDRVSNLQLTAES